MPPLPFHQLLFLFIFILAFFPSAFQSVLKLPLIPLTFLFSSISKTPLTPPAPPCPPHCLPATFTNTTTGTINHNMAWFQKSLTLPSRSRGSYLITDEIVSALPEISSYKVGLLNLFVQHTSCALSMNENWDEDVRADMSDALDRIAPEDKSRGLYRHSAEGKDDMPAHIKSSLIGSSVTIPISNGKLAMGTWQGIWYLEFRARKHTRNLVATIQGEKG